jgi:hypothetical protein
MALLLVNSLCRTYSEREMAAIAACIHPVAASESLEPKNGWREDKQLMKWLEPL